MRPVKFRGRDIDTGEFVYAELGEVSAKLNPEYLTFITDDVHTIAEDSIAQLVGYDCNGREVYEGDELTDNRAEIYGDKVTAVLKPHIHHELIQQAEFFDRFWGKELVQDWQVKLKEAQS